MIVIGLPTFKLVAGHTFLLDKTLAPLVLHLASS